MRHLLNLKKELNDKAKKKKCLGLLAQKNRIDS